MYVGTALGLPCYLANAVRRTPVEQNNEGAQRPLSGASERTCKQADHSVSTCGSELINSHDEFLRPRRPSLRQRAQIQALNVSCSLENAARLTP